MTRKSKREIERSLEKLDPDTGTNIDFVWRDQRTGEFVDRDGESTEPDPDADQVIVIDESVVMERERAEREGREILGLYEDAPEGRDVVRIAWDGRYER